MTLCVRRRRRPPHHQTVVDTLKGIIMLHFMVTLQTLVTERKDALVDRANDRGATAVEYGLLVALIAAVIVAVVATLGGQINAAFTTISNAL